MGNSKANFELDITNKRKLGVTFEFFIIGICTYIHNVFRYLQIKGGKTYIVYNSVTVNGSDRQKLL